MNALEITLSLLAAASVSFAQDEPPRYPPPQQQNPPANGGWRRIGDQPPNPPNYDDRNDPQGNPQGNYPPPNYTVPPQLTIRPGTFVTVRLNQPLSSDHNQVGDAFSATLVRPIVVEGIVVAQHGETIGGRVAEVQKAGRVQGTSRLGIEVTDLTLVDGQVVPIQCQLINHNGSTSWGRDATAIGATTATGAAIGAGVNGGVGAGVGAAAGIVVSTIGVLLTRGHETVIYPESVLTFRVEAPITISTEHSTQAFRYVEPNEYDQPAERRMPARGPGNYPPRPRPYYYGGYYPYYGPAYRFYAGPSLFYGFGPRYHFRGGRRW